MFIVTGVLAVALLVGAGSAQAAPITVYTSATTWGTAAGGTVTVEDFSDATLVSGLAIDFGNFLPPNNIDGGTWNDTALTYLNLDSDQPKVTFTPGTTAFGADWDLTPFGAGSGFSVNLHFVDNTTNSFNITNAGTQAFVGFMGVVSSVAIDSFIIKGLDFSGNGESFSADNLRFVSGTTDPGGNPDEHVPEPGTLALLGTGLFTMIGRGLRRRTQ
jgi:hypothetical protein